MPTGRTVKDRVFDLIPPAMIAMVLLFWSFGPPALLKSPWTLPVTAPLIIVAVLLLEQVNERHAGWRLTKREFLTDLYYTGQSATVVSWVSIFPFQPLIDKYKARRTLSAGGVTSNAKRERGDVARDTAKGRATA